MIDSLNGYQIAMPEEDLLILHMHELLQYLNRRGATTFLTVAQHGLVGDMKSPVDVTYLADTVILLRYFEATGRVRRAMSVVKKRTGSTRGRSANIGSARTGSALESLWSAFRASCAVCPPSARMASCSRTPALNPEFSERALILLPGGRDSEVASAMLQEAGQWLRRAFRSPG